MVKIQPKSLLGVRAGSNAPRMRTCCDWYALYEKKREDVREIKEES